ncbi:MAG: hypothetical protein WBJ13_05740 [Sedimentibacter sp.]
MKVIDSINVAVYNKWKTKFSRVDNTKYFAKNCKSHTSCHNHVMMLFLVVVICKKLSFDMAIN